MSESQRRRGKEKQGVGFCGCSSKALQFHTVTLNHSYILLPLVCFFPAVCSSALFSPFWQHVIYAIWDTLNSIIFIFFFTNMLNYLYSLSYFNQTFDRLTLSNRCFSFFFVICHIWATVGLFLSPVSSVFWLLAYLFFIFFACIGVTCPEIVTPYDTCTCRALPCFDSLLRECLLRVTQLVSKIVKQGKLCVLVHMQNWRTLTCECWHLVLVFLHNMHAADVDVREKNKNNMWK